MKKWCIQKKYGLMFMLLIFCIAYHVISKSYGFYFPADEFGYWSYAAKIAGYDWSDIASLGSYYSYGYSLILLPVFIVFKNGIIAYRVALLVNFMLLAVCFFVIQKIDKFISPFHAAVAVFYPAWIFYAGTTFAEVLLFTLYTVICLLLLSYLRTDKKYFLALMFAAMLYMYLVHMRAVAIMASGITVLAVHELKNGGKRVKYLFILIVCMTLALAVGFYIKKYWTSLVYGDATNGLSSANDYTGQFGKVAYIFTPSGFKNLIAGIAGKLLYLGLASFGSAYFGIGYAMLKIKEKKIFPLFVLLSTFAAVMISAIYVVQPWRVDMLAYGRYHEYLMPVLMTIGIGALGMKKLSLGKTICAIGAIVVLEAAMTWLVTESLRESGLTKFFGNTICAISWLYNPEGFEPTSFYWRAYFVGAALTVVFCMGIWWIGRKRGREVFLMVLVAAEIAIGIRQSTAYIDASRLGCYRDTLVMQKMQEINPENDRGIFYSTGGDDYGNIGILQFMMRDTKINIVKQNFDLNSQRREDLLLIDYRDAQSKELGEAYGNQMTSGHFTLFYNEIE